MITLHLSIFTGTGIATNDVICKEGLQLIFKEENGSPSCVKPGTSKILIERGWAQSITK